MYLLLFIWLITSFLPLEGGGLRWGCILPLLSFPFLICHSREGGNPSPPSLRGVKRRGNLILPFSVIANSPFHFPIYYILFYLFFIFSFVLLDTIFYFSILFSFLTRYYILNAIHRFRITVFIYSTQLCEILLFFKNILKIFNRPLARRFFSIFLFRYRGQHLPVIHYHKLYS